MPRDQFALRAQALLVDLLIAAVAMLTVGFVVGANWGSLAATIAAAITGGLYSTIEIFTAASPGKMCVSFKIAGVYSYQARTGTLLARWAMKNTPWLLKIASLATGSALLGWAGVAVGLALVAGFFLALRPEGLVGFSINNQQSEISNSLPRLTVFLYVPNLDSLWL